MSEHYLAFDLGATSGRAILGRLNDGRLRLAQLHRFPNNMMNLRGNLHWNIFGLYREMLQGMRVCAAKYANSTMSIGVDTWGVDFGLFNAQGNLVGLPFAYRNWSRHNIMEKFFSKIPKERLYQTTGTQFMPINTVFQLYSMVCDENPWLDTSSDLLFMADIFNYFLTGIKNSEFTLATTSQLYNPKTGDWDDEIFEHLHVSKGMMQQIVQPGTIIGDITEETASQTGFRRIPVSAVASHDTGSAVAAVPASRKSFAYISSGTWSLMGIESPKAIIDKKTFEYNFTNEGGVRGTFCVLKNITGLWLLSECRREWAKSHEYSYSELIQKAEESVPFRSIIDPNLPEFLNPVNMPLAIEAYCKATNQPAPRHIGQCVRTILESLALAYRNTLVQLEEVGSRDMEQINIVGGGSQNHLLCQLTADATGLPVYAGPVEATAIGNILVQAMALGKISSLEDLRGMVRRSFALNLYQPHYNLDWDNAYERFLSLKENETKVGED